MDSGQLDNNKGDGGNVEINARRTDDHMITKKIQLKRGSGLDGKCNAKEQKLHEDRHASNVN